MSEVPLYTRAEICVSVSVRACSCPGGGVKGVVSLPQPSQAPLHVRRTRDYRGTSLISNPHSVRPYSSLMLILGGWVFLMSEIPLHHKGYTNDMCLRPRRSRRKSILTQHTTRRSTTLSSKVNLHRAINFRATLKEKNGSNFKRISGERNFRSPPCGSVSFVGVPRP